MIESKELSSNYIGNLNEPTGDGLPMASNQIAMASNLIFYNGGGPQPNSSDGLQPNSSDGLPPNKI